MSVIKKTKLKPAGYKNSLLAKKETQKLLECLDNTVIKEVSSKFAEYTDNPMVKEVTSNFKEYINNPMIKDAVSKLAKNTDNPLIKEVASNFPKYANNPLVKKAVSKLTERQDNSIVKQGVSNSEKHKYNPVAEPIELKPAPRPIQFVSEEELKPVEYRHIKIDCAFKIQTLYSLKIQNGINEHSTLCIRAMISDEEGDRIPTIFPNPKITVHETSNNKNLFVGRLTNYSIDNDNGIFIIDIEAKSYTADMDLVECNQSFQNENMKYSDIVFSILKKYPGAQTIIEAEKEDRSIGTPVIQFKETDWRFLKRIASHLGVPLVAHSLSSAPNFYFGFPKIKERKMKDFVSYDTFKDLKSYHAKSAQNPDLFTQDFFGYKVKTLENFAVGDIMRFKNKNVTVLESTMEIEAGMLWHTYKLGFKESAYQLKIYNDIFSGMSLMGEVLATQGEQLKVRLDIDKQQDVGTAYWYPFAPATGNMMYCMPQVGTKVELHVPSSDESQALVIACVRTNGGTNESFGDSSNRYLATEEGRELKLAPSGIEFNYNIGAHDLSLLLNDETGIEFLSNKKISITAKEGIEIISDTKVLCTSPNMLLFEHKDSRSIVVLEANFNAFANISYMSGSRKVSLPVFSNELVSVEPPEPPPFNWFALIVAVVVIVAVVAVSVATFGAGAVVGAALAGAVIGAACGAGSTIVGSLINGEPINWMDVLVNAGIGAVTGAVAGVVGLTGCPALAGAYAGFIGNLLNQSYAQYKDPWYQFDAGSLLTDTAFGALGGAVFGKMMPKGVFNGAKQCITGKMAKEIAVSILAGAGLSGVHNAASQLNNIYFSPNKERIYGKENPTLADFSWGQVGKSSIQGGATTAIGIAAGKLYQMAANKINPGSYVCFVAGTPVVTPKGLVAIEKISVGDLVISTNPETGETAEKQVLRTFINKAKEFIYLKVNGEEIITTPAHPFYVAKLGWVEAANLKVGNHLNILNEKNTSIDEVRFEVLNTINIYNFEVEDFHTYRVGKEGILVHNECEAKQATEHKVIKPGTKEWAEAVKAISEGGNTNYRVNSATEAKQLLTEARGNMNNYKRYVSQYSKGYEMHPNESHTQNAPHNNLPHIKWKDWLSITSPGKGHIFFDKPN